MCGESFEEDGEFLGKANRKEFHAEDFKTRP
jgi:hypothetical protein